MKLILAWFLATVFACSSVLNVLAQADESIWLEANTTAYQAGETVIVTVDARSATPIQGFTFQIRYDPACLKPVNAASPIAGMNGLSLPQQAGLVDASFASTTPQSANGVLAEVRFLSLGTCQTDLVLESAALAIRDQSGFAAPLGGVAIAEKRVVLNIASGAGGAKPTPPVIGTPLPLGVQSSSPNLGLWAIITLAIMLAVGGLLFRLLHLSRKGSAA